MSSAQPAEIGRLAPHYDRVIRGLVQAHSTRDDEPLLLAVRYRRDDLEDLHLLEVIENFPGNDDDPLFRTEFGPSADLVILGKLHLILASPAQLRAAVGRGDPLFAEVKADGQVLFPAGAPEGEALALLQLIGIA